jgi:hypothetical protein
MKVRCLIIFLFTVMSYAVQGQVTHASISQHEITVGERVTLSYSLPLNENNTIDFRSYKKFIPVYKETPSGKNGKVFPNIVEITSPFRDTMITQSGKTFWTANYEITVWDSGAFIIPGPEITIEKKRLQFPSVSIKGVYTPIVQGRDLEEIQQSFANLPNRSFAEKWRYFIQKYGVWFVSILLLTGAVWVYFHRRKRRKEVQNMVLSPYEYAMRKLDALEKQTLWNKGQLKTHYTELTILLRSYLSEVYDVHLLERTTSEILVLLKTKIPTLKCGELLKVVLEEADLVKFAKYHPDEFQTREHLQKCVAILNEVNAKTRITNE